MTMATNMNRRRRRMPLETMTTMAAVVPVLALALGLATLKGVQARALLQEGKEGKASPNAITVPTPPEDTARLLNETFKVTTPEGTIEVSRGQMAWQNGFVNGFLGGYAVGYADAKAGKEPRFPPPPLISATEMEGGGRRSLLQQQQEPATNEDGTPATLSPLDDMALDPDQEAVLFVPVDITLANGTVVTTDYISLYFNDGRASGFFRGYSMGYKDGRDGKESAFPVLEEGGD